MIIITSAIFTYKKERKKEEKEKKVPKKRKRRKKERKKCGAIEIAPRKNTIII